MLLLPCATMLAHAHSAPTLNQCWLAACAPQRGSAMFFIIKDLATVNHMYRFSLSVFMALFKQALGQVRRGCMITCDNFMT